MAEDADFKQKVKDITDSGMTPEEKIDALNNLQAGLNQLNDGAQIILISETGALIAAKADRPEMAAQFCLIRAKVEMAGSGALVGEMKNIKMSIDWFGFGLEAEEKRYKKLEADFNASWNRARAVIDMGYKFLNKRPFVGAVAYCHRTVGEIYGQRYLHLKLHLFVSVNPWRAKIANYAISRWLGIDDLLTTNKESRAQLRAIKKDCIGALHQAKRLFAREKAWAFLVETYFTLALEHHSFNDTVRSKFYLWWGWLCMRLHGLSEPRLDASFKSLRKFPLIGSNRDDDIARELRPKIDPEETA